MDSKFRIEGNFINLRATIKSDLKNYEKWNSPDLKTYQFDGPWYKTDEAPLKGVINWRIRWLEGETKTPYPFLEIETKEKLHIGWVTAYYHEDDPHMTEIGINIPEDSYWGKGMGFEALYLWIDYLFNERDLTRLGFSTWEGNKSMLKVGEKLGFVEESRIRKSCEVKGVLYDRIKMGILRSEWKKKKECNA
ncbi:GNAT family N-acetyltransferase [candidate division WOR-3 bacterium]|nr:GNAT family N-acetyltransferase [candidate division WOR-3 bacterium]